MADEERPTEASTKDAERVRCEPWLGNRHMFYEVSGGGECNHTLYECRKCRRQWMQIHEWAGPHRPRHWDKWPKWTGEKCPVAERPFEPLG